MLIDEDWKRIRKGGRKDGGLMGFAAVDDFHDQNVRPQLGSNWSVPVHEGPAWLQAHNCLYFYLGLLAGNSLRYLSGPCEAPTLKGPLLLSSKALWDR